MMTETAPTPEIQVPPFPRLRWAAGDWAGTAVLSAWTGFQSRRGAYGSRDSANPSDGRIPISVGCQSPNNREQPSMAQRKAYETLMAQQEVIRDTMLAALLDRYGEWRVRWAEEIDGEDEFESLMPPVSDVEGFRDLIGLAFIHVLSVEKGGLAYTGYELGCTWDDEHGLGFMMHGDRVVKLGDADTSFLAWIAEQDAETPLG